MTDLMDIGARKARTWFDTVFNPLIDNLERERYYLEKGNYGFMFYSNTVENVREARNWIPTRYLPNLEDVLKKRSDIDEVLREHDTLVNQVKEICTNIFNRAVDDEKLRNYLFNIEKEMNEDYEKNADLKYMYQSVLSDFKNNQDDVRKYIVTYIINNQRVLGTNHTYYPIFKYYGDVLYSIWEDEGSAFYKEKVELSGKREDLKKVVTNAISKLKNIRQEYSDKLDVPIVVD